jgi:hypothetical protein
MICSVFLLRGKLKIKACIMIRWSPLSAKRDGEEGRG